MQTIVGVATLAVVDVACLTVAFVILSQTIAFRSANPEMTKPVLVHSAGHARVSYHSERGLPLG
jgi:hypothetical protein